MAITAVTALTPAASASSSLTQAVTITAAVGDLVILLCAADNNGTSGVSSTSTSVTDATGNTWNLADQTTQSPGNAANDGTTHTSWQSRITNALVAASVTVNFSPNTASKVVGGWVITGTAPTVASVGTAAKGSGAAHNASTVSVPVGHVIIGASAVEMSDASTPDADTTNGNWSSEQIGVATGGSTGQSQTLSTQYKIVSAAGNQSYSTSSASGRDFVVNTILVYDAVGTLSATLGALTLSGTATLAIKGAASPTLSPVTLSATGALAIKGAAAPTLGALTLSAAATAAISGSLAGTLGPVTLSAVGVVGPPRAGTRSIRILIRFDWPDDQVTRLWAGNGAFIDGDGAVWRGAGLITGIDELERAVNGEAPAITVTLSGLSAETSGKVWAYYQAGNLIDAEMRVLLQSCDDFDQPVGTARTVFTGFFSNAVFDDAGGDQPVSAVSAEITNKFTLRRIPNWAVLSDADQKARSAVLNPLASPDRFAERVSLNENKTVTWPRFN